MTAHTLVDERARRRTARNGLSQLGWPHFWLLSGILAGILALVAMVFFVSLSVR